MIRLALLLILLIPLAQPQPPAEVRADWAGLEPSGHRTATLQWLQQSEATSVCIVKKVRLQSVLIDCVPGNPGWHFVQIPPELPADGLHWPEIGDQYWIIDQSPYGEHGPYGLEWVYWVPRIDR